MTGAEIYIMANGAVLILILRQLMKIERRLGCGDWVIHRLKEHCRLFVLKKKKGG